ncbi:VanZ family protein [Cytobacillus spongiae]|uniref:VanZ family protein n=1 Tax=Cytobacillus spongiae TaxID=2901381 RepID=UPI001F350631|nr:VanZ family protein [Cytobacillus spongiae]UII55720.1 VanZ family protein [Cytobacillus spongiae]
MNKLKWLLIPLPFLYMALIWKLSSMPANAIVELSYQSIDRFIKESMHLIEFAILYILLVLAFLSVGRFSAQINWLCILIACSYGIIDEIHQSFIPYRSATIIDAVKDITGVLVAAYIVRKKLAR